MEPRSPHPAEPLSPGPKDRHCPPGHRAIRLVTRAAYGLVHPIVGPLVRRLAGQARYGEFQNSNHIDKKFRDLCRELRNHLPNNHRIGDEPAADAVRLAEVRRLCVEIEELFLTPALRTSPVKLSATPPPTRRAQGIRFVSAALPNGVVYELSVAQDSADPVLPGVYRRLSAASRCGPQPPSPT